MCTLCDKRVRSKLLVPCQRWWLLTAVRLHLSEPHSKRRNAKLLHTAHQRKLWEFLNPSVQLHTGISSVLYMTRC
jgi:transposase